MRRLLVWWDINDVGMKLACALFILFCIFALAGKVTSSRLLNALALTLALLAVLMALTDLFVARFLNRL